MLPYISKKNIIKSAKVLPELKTFWLKLRNYITFDKQIGQLTDRTDFIRFYLDVPVPPWPYLELVLVPVSIFGLVIFWDISGSTVSRQSRTWVPWTCRSIHIQIAQTIQQLVMLEPTLRSVHCMFYKFCRGLIKTDTNNHIKLRIWFNSWPIELIKPDRLKWLDISWRIWWVRWTRESLELWSLGLGLKLGRVG